MQKFTKNTPINVQNNLNNIESQNILPIKNKTLNPNEISQLTQNDASTTPILSNVSRNKVSDGNSKFFDNVLYKTDMLDNNQKKMILSDNEVKYYDKITNKESLTTAYERLNNGGQKETMNWFGKDSSKADSIDVAEGWILLNQYAQNNDSEGMVATAKKLRDMGTKAGQAVQAFNIMERMTPEGMVAYAQSELSEAYDKMVKNKSREWIDKYRADFDLKPEEVQFIMDNMKEASKMEDGYNKKVKLAEIQKLMTDKLPPTKGSGIKSWMRISMLFNPKTQVRNIAGNALIAPINYFGDLFSSYTDKLIAKKTGVRTTGNMNVKAILEGIKKGAYEATNDYRKGINTKDMEGNRFEIGEGKSFSDKNIIGKNLNRVDSLLNYMLDVGDRVFSESSFENSLQNQMILNNTTEVTQEMIDIARQESLSRTWNDSNGYTKLVLDIRKGFNKVNVRGYGLGDVLIPFAKTPANLTKAIVDYSPAGMINTIIEGNNLRKSLNNGQFTPQMQHRFVQDLGKATAGSILYVAGYALAKAGITSGESDKDKDVKDFMKNTLGVNSYSIKIGNKSFTYDWAQPIAAPLSIMANIVNKKNEDVSLLEKVTSSLDTAGNILLEQSFMQSIQTALNNNDGLATGIEEAILELPSRAVPTFVKQVVDLTDSTSRTSFEYDKPLESAVNKIKAKIPGLSKTLAPVVDTMGREVQRYGGKNNIFNVFLNPANVSNENVSESAKEIYRLYNETGKTDIMPRVAPYYINKKGEKIVLTSEEKTKYQKLSGDIIEKQVKKLLNSTEYKNMSNLEKVEVINDVVNYSYNIAQKEILNLDLSDTYKKAYEYSEIGEISDYYTFKNSIDNTNKDTKRESIKKFLINSDLNDKQIAFMYSVYYSTEQKLNSLIDMRIPIKEFIKLNSEDIESDYNEKTGVTISNSKKKKTMQYINELELSIPQKAILIKMQYSSYKDYNNEIIKYIDTNVKTKEEKIKVLQELGFTIRDGKVYQ